MTSTTSQPGLSSRAFAIRVWLMVGLAIVAVAAVFLIWREPFPQDPNYHHFADTRSFLSIPNCLNVLSNAPFLLVGVLGLGFVLSRAAMRPGGPFRTPGERRPFVLLFLGLGLTAFGSGYYHLDPDNEHLLWDRLPMTIGFMSLFAAIIGDRINRRLGTALLWPLLILGMASVLWWHVTEMEGRGDLRFYILVQFYPLLAIPLLLLLFPPAYTRTVDLWIALGWYGLAKLFEALDRPIYGLLGESVSGHSLKHLAAAGGGYWLLRMLQKRSSIEVQG